MSALSNNRAVPKASWRFKQFTLASGSIAYQGGQAFLNSATGKVVPGTAAASGMVFIGLFAEKIDASSADKLVNVDLQTEISLVYFANGSSIVSTDVGKLCYSDDDQTVVLSAGTRALCGRIMDVDAIKGVGVDVNVSLSSALGARPLAGPALAYVANDAAPADVVAGAVYDVPTTAAASTITLPAASADGTVAYFAADGAKNGHTIQYRDATGTVLLTTALLASKRHLTVAAKVNGKWTANAYVSP